MPRVHYDRGYRLRIEHADRAEIRLVRDGRTVVFDPADPPEAGDIIVLTGPAADRTRATAAAVRAGQRPTVSAAPEVAEWLRGLGPLDEVGPALDGLKFDALEYTPPPFVRPPARELAGALGSIRPGAALRTMRERAASPTGLPRVVQVTLPDGARLLHVDLALHRRTDAAWVDAAVARFGEPEWLIAAAAYGESDGVADLAARFKARRVLLAELVNGERRALGLPCELVTPLRDRLVATGVEAHVFATQTSFRFA